MKSRKLEIVSAARTVLIRDGSAGFSVRRVAQEAGISLGNLQYHFSTKVDLLEGLLATDIAEYRRVFTQMREQEAGQSKDTRAQIERFLVRALGDAKHHEEVAVFKALFSFTDPEIVAKLHAYYKDLYGLLVDGIAEITKHDRDSTATRRAAALLFPYLDGYETSAEIIELDSKQVAQLLADAIWRIVST